LWFCSFSFLITNRFLPNKNFHFGSSACLNKLKEESSTDGPQATHATESSVQPHFDSVSIASAPSVTVPNEQPPPKVVVENQSTAFTIRVIVAPTGNLTGTSSEQACTVTPEQHFDQPMNRSGFEMSL
jgi:hypothetical protein